MILDSLDAGAMSCMAWRKLGGWMDEAKVKTKDGKTFRIVAIGTEVQFLNGEFCLDT
jgi:hypothetical protein